MCFPVWVSPVVPEGLTGRHVYMVTFPRQLLSPSPLDEHLCGTTHRAIEARGKDMVVGCARAGGGDGSSGKLSVGILFATPGGFGLCMRGVVAVGDGNPTDILVPRVSLGHMVTSCKHAPWDTTAMGVRWGA